MSAQTGLPVVSVPTTYSGAEWTTFFGMRDEERGIKGGGSGATLAAIVYDPRLTLDLPPAETAGTAMNALAHAAEALYTTTRDPAGDEDALAGAALIAEALPAVLAAPGDLDARTRLLRGAMHAGAALERLVHGPRPRDRAGARRPLRPAARRHERAGPRAHAPLQRARRRGGAAPSGDVLGGDAAQETERLARLGGFERLRDFGVPEDELPAVAAATVVRPAARANPRQATAQDVEGILLRIS